MLITGTVAKTILLLRRRLFDDVLHSDHHEISNLPTDYRALSSAGGCCSSPRSMHFNPEIILNLFSNYRSNNSSANIDIEWIRSSELIIIEVHRQCLYVYIC